MLAQEDLKKYCKVSLSLEELIILADLLRYEAMIQTSLELQKYKPEEKDKLLATSVNKLLTVFDSYRELDDFLANLAYSIVGKDKSNLDYKATKSIVLNKPICVYFKALCTQTVKDSYPDLKTRFTNGIGPTLLSKLELALVSEVSQDEFNAFNFKPVLQRKGPDFTSSKKVEATPKKEEDKKLDNGLSINILGKTGIA